MFGEALPAVDTGRGTNDLSGVRRALDAIYASAGMAVPAKIARGDVLCPPLPVGQHGPFTDGIRIVVQNPRIFRPVTTSIAILECLQRLYGAARIWRAKGARPDYDKLYGSSLPRIQLQQGGDWKTISAGWRVGLRRFNAERREFCCTNGFNPLASHRKQQREGKINRQDRQGGGILATKMHKDDTVI